VWGGRLNAEEKKQKAHNSSMEEEGGGEFGITGKILTHFVKN